MKVLTNEIIIGVNFNTLPIEIIFKCYECGNVIERFTLYGERNISGMMVDICQDCIKKYQIRVIK